MDPHHDWFLPAGIRNDGYFKSINVGRLCKKGDDDYILATQAKKVFYLTDRDPANKGWKIVQTYDHRHLYNVCENEDIIFGADAYQEEEPVDGQGLDTFTGQQEPGTSAGHSIIDPPRRTEADIVEKMIGQHEVSYDDDTGEEIYDTTLEYADHHDKSQDIDSDDE